ncbi:hypothetical protein H2248_011871 [Termitomyces sp. 'cryptogamus']|nr:hypothetical protein H2248_011871 [Termitomyces sp. 'cryptogamus']
MSHPYSSSATYIYAVNDERVLFSLPFSCPAKSQIPLDIILSFDRQNANTFDNTRRDLGPASNTPLFFTKWSQNFPPISQGQINKLSIKNMPTCRGLVPPAWSTQGDRVVSITDDHLRGFLLHTAQVQRANLSSMYQFRWYILISFPSPRELPVHPCRPTCPTWSLF